MRLSEQHAFWRRHFQDRRPRRLRARERQPPAACFMDEAVEDADGGHEGPPCVSTVVAKEKVEDWVPLGTLHPAFLAELPLVVATTDVWKRRSKRGGAAGTW